ncbi:MAG: ribonuclease III domain-containing protein [Limnothrix sp.]
MLALPITPEHLNQLSPAALAYVGDAVYELYIRCHYLTPPNRISTHHQRVVATVRAETQSEYLAIWEPYLGEIEQSIIRRGRNTATGKPKRVSLDIYRRATGFEALIGYLYLTNEPRLRELLNYLPLREP